MKRLKQFISYIGLLGDKLEEMNKRLRDMEKQYVDLTAVLKFSISDGVFGRMAFNMNGVQSGLEFDYFTKEFVSTNATNTKELYVVSGMNIVQRYFKDGNQTKDVKIINDKYYIFIK